MLKSEGNLINDGFEKEIGAQPAAGRESFSGEKKLRLRKYILKGKGGAQEKAIAKKILRSRSQPLCSALPCRIKKTKILSSARFTMT